MAATQAVLTYNTGGGEVQGTREVMIIQTLYSLDHLVGCYIQYSMIVIYRVLLGLLFLGYIRVILESERLGNLPKATELKGPSQDSSPRGSSFKAYFLI